MIILGNIVKVVGWIVLSVAGLWGFFLCLAIISKAAGFWGIVVALSIGPVTFCCRAALRWLCLGRLVSIGS